MNKFLFPVLSVIAAVGLYFFFITGQLERIDELKAQDERFSNSLNDVRAIESAIGKLESSYASISQEDLHRLERFLPREIDMTQLIRDINTLLSEENLTIKSISASEGTDNPKKKKKQEGPVVKEHGVGIVFASTYETFKVVLDKLEKNLQIATIGSVSVGSSRSVETEEVSEDGFSNYGISLTFYSYDTLEGEQ